MRNKNFIKDLFGLMLKKIREESGLTVKEMAIKLDIGTTFYRHIEGGHARLNVDNVIKLYSIFDGKIDIQKTVIVLTVSKWIEDCKDLDSLIETTDSLKIHFDGNESLIHLLEKNVEYHNDNKYRKLNALEKFEKMESEGHVQSMIECVSSPYNNLMYEKMSPDNKSANMLKILNKLSNEEFQAILKLLHLFSKQED